jgi:TonB family protein
VPALSATPQIAAAVLIRQPGLLDGHPVPGAAVMRVLARPGERVREVALDASSGDAAFDDAALNTVRRWRYVPAFTTNSGAPEWLLIRLVARPEARFDRLSAR